MDTIFTPQTIFVKTMFGRAELTVRSHGLSLLERRILILADGSRSVVQLQAMMNAPVDAMVEQLHALHLIVPEGDAQNSSVSGHAALLASMGRGRAQPVQALASVPAKVPSSIPANIVAKVAPSPTPVAAVAVAATPANNRNYDASVNELASLAVNIAPSPIPVAMVAQVPADDYNYDASADEVASNYSEELTSDQASEFERQVSAYSMPQDHSDSGMSSDPSSTLQRATTARGVALGKAYLINLTSTMLDSRDIRLVRSIGQIKTEDDLYQQFGEVIDIIAMRMGTNAINDILERFDQEINRA